jgi:hypothetical protein
METFEFGSGFPISSAEVMPVKLAALSQPQGNVLWPMLRASIAPRKQKLNAPGP